MNSQNWELLLWMVDSSYITRQLKSLQLLGLCEDMAAFVGIRKRWPSACTHEENVLALVG